MPSSPMIHSGLIYASGSHRHPSPMTDVVYCIECLRLVIAAKTTVLQDVSAYGVVGTSETYGHPKPTQARYVVDGTWYCGTHALAVYEASATHLILEDI